MARNKFYMARKYPREYPMWKVSLKELEARLLILLYEADKGKKLSARMRGARDARTGKMGECSSHF